MKLYKIFQTVNNDYDTYDSAIVCAESVDDAKKINPGYKKETTEKNDVYDSWCKLSEVQVEYIGQAKSGLERGIICASFNAG